MESSQIQAQNSLNDVKKEANKLFEDDEFTKAYKLYAQLVSNFPNEAEYNYRLGVCMIFSEPAVLRSTPRWITVPLIPLSYLVALSCQMHPKAT